MALQRTAPDRLAVQRGHDEKTLGRREVRGSKRNTARGIEAGPEARRELLVVAPETVLHSPAPRILHTEADRTRKQQPLHGAHGGDEGRSLGLGKPTQEGSGGLIRPAVPQRQFLSAPRPQLPPPPARVAPRSRGAGEALGLESAEQAAGIPGVQV